MAIRKIRRYPRDEALLRTKSAPVRQIDSTVRRLIADLKATMEDAMGLGLAAPQVGVLKRVCVVQLGADREEPGPVLALINPVILDAGPLDRGYDGCLSIPGLQGYTRRPLHLRVRALTEAGETVEYEWSGLDARVAHHEIDHLDGILYFDRLESLDDLFYIEEGDVEDEVLFVPYLDVHPETLLPQRPPKSLPVARERMP